MQLEYIIKCDAYQIYMDLSRLVYGCIWYMVSISKIFTYSSKILVLF